MKRTQITPLLLVSTIIVMGSCVKSSLDSRPLSSSTTSLSEDTSSSRMVATPFGMRKASDAIHIEPGYHLRWDGDNLRKVDGTGKIVSDYGRQQPLSYVSSVSHMSTVRTMDASKGTSQSAPVPDLSGWVTYAQTPETAPVTYFSTTWTVPTAPTTYDGQTLFLFNGLQDGFSSTNHILQPVLQYGDGADLSNAGANWYVDNWYASCNGCTAYYGTAVKVTAGTSLTGVMQQTAVSGSSYSYSSSFTGSAYSGATVSVEGVPALTYPFETMETYNIEYSSDYSPDTYVSMSNIQLETAGGVYPTLSWEAVNPSTIDVGEHTVVESNSNPGGDVDLYFHQAPITGGGQFNYSLSSPTGSGTVTGPAGRYVTVNLEAKAIGMNYSLNMKMTLAGGVTFLGSGTNVLSVTNGSTSDAFYMPASGSVSWTGSFTGTPPSNGNNSGYIYIF